MKMERKRNIVIDADELVYGKQRVRKFVFYFTKAFLFVFTLIMTWVVVKQVLTIPISQEIILFMGVILGVIILYSFFFLVFVEFADTIKKA